MEMSSLANRSFLAIIALSSLGGCGAEANSAEEGDLDSVQEAWATAPCAAAKPNITRYDHLGSSGNTSPQTYDNCKKSYVLDLIGLAPAYAQPGAKLMATYADTMPTNRAECEDLEGGAIFYKQVNNQWVAQTGQVYSTGVWSPGSTGPIIVPARCAVPSASYTPTTAGASYRIAATMRSLSGSNPTRKVRFSSLEPPFVPE